MKFKLARPSTASIVLFVFATGMMTQSVISRVIAHGGDTNLIHSCVKNSNGSVRIIGPNDDCNNNETATDWSKDGGSGMFSEYPVCPNCDLTSKVLTGLNLDRAYFIKTKLSGLNLSGIVLTNSFLDGSDMSNTNLSNANLSNTSAIDIKLTGSDMRGSNLHGSSFVGDLQNILLNNAISTSSTLGGDFTGATATNVNFNDSALNFHAPGVDFSNSTMRDSQLGGQANYSNAKFINVDMSNSLAQQNDFTNVDWQNANLTNVSLNNSDLTGSLNFDTAIRTGIEYNNTTCPDGTDSDNNGNTCEGHLVQ